MNVTYDLIEWKNILEVMRKYTYIYWKVGFDGCLDNQVGLSGWVEEIYLMEFCFASLSKIVLLWFQSECVNE